jgi:AraC-like DNA-binding protein
LYDSNRDCVLAKIAHELNHALARRAAGAEGRLSGRVLARGDGWIVEDVICTCGPDDRPFEERHSWVSMAMVVAGTFQYDGDCRAGRGPELMTPGSLLLGNPGQYFECAHTHGTGDRCISFRYAPEYFERISADLGMRASRTRFRQLRVPPLAPLAPLVARSCAALLRPADGAWEEMSLDLVEHVLHLAGGGAAAPHQPSRGAVARVTRTVRTIERCPDAAFTLSALARLAGLSPYHFLRIFERVAGVTPHQYVRRARLREAATRLAVDPSKIVEVALACGFGDVSNFNRAFRTEFGVSPRTFRASKLPTPTSQLPK